MINYLGKRLLLVIPTMVFISFICFLLSKCTPQDPVTATISLRGVDQDILDNKLYDQVYQELNLHLPNFYFSILPNHYPPNLNTIISKEEKTFYKKLLSKAYWPKDIDSAIATIRKNKSTQDSSFHYMGDQSIMSNDTSVDSFFKMAGMNAQELGRNKFLLPKLIWHGTNNQYHRWLDKAINNGFGVSIKDGLKAIDKVKKALMWTLSFTLIDFVLSVFLALAIGYYLASDPHAKSRVWLRNLLYLFYAMPVFWLATMLVLFFTTDDYGTWTNIFPAVGMDIYPGKSTVSQIFMNLDKLILPIICLTLHSLAYVSRMVENGLNDEINKPYVMNAYSKGLSKGEALRKEVFKNALIPMITVFTASLAAAFAGSLVLEVIFNIPGMGRLMFNSLLSADWDVVFCILTVMSLVTIVSYILGDILYAFFNPKIKMS